MSLSLLLLCGIGGVTGLLLGLTGAGGGLVAAPLLMLLLKLPITQAAPMALMAVVLGAGLGSALGLRKGTVRYRAALVMAVAGILVSPLGIALAHRLPAALLTVAFSVLLLYQAWRQWTHPSVVADAQMPCALSPATGRFQWNRPCARAMVGSGLLAGFLSGLLGVGGGFVLVPALRRHTPLPMHSISATSLMVLTLVSLAGIAQWSVQGAVDFALAGPFVLSAMIGMALGHWGAHRVPERVLGRLFALFCLVIGLGLMLRLV